MKQGAGAGAPTAGAPPRLGSAGQPRKVLAHPPNDDVEVEPQRNPEVDIFRDTTTKKASKNSNPQQPKQQRDDGRRLHILFPAYWHAFWPDCAGHGHRLSAGVAIGGPTSQLQQKPAEPLAFWQRPVFSATASSRLQLGTTNFEAN